MKKEDNNEGRVFVMSDVHGQREMFFDVLKKANFSDKDTLYVLGDVVDRGDHSVELLRYIQKKSNMTLLMGNHEEMMISALNEDESGFYSWIYNGGAPTHKEYVELSKEEQVEVYNYLNSLPLYKVIEVNGREYLLVHAGVRLDKNPQTLEECIESQIRCDLLWIREEFLEVDTDHLPFTIVHGHTPTIYYEEFVPGKKGVHELDKILVEPGRIGVDCGAGSGAVLGLMCLTDGSQYYSKWKH